MDLSPATWHSISKLLDEALDLEPAARITWLEKLSATQPEIAPAVRQLLEAHASSETADVLAKPFAVDVAVEHAARRAGLAAGDRVGPYRLLREIGAGGMADVWLAARADGAFAREVALKLPRVSLLRRDLAARFARERDILARLEHPHIARLYDAGITRDELPYLAMEYVDGQPITAYCDRQRLSIHQRLHLFNQVLEAVQYAHANLIIHRDLKPSNILITHDGQARLLDFGIAKLLEGEAARETQLTQLSGRALTPDYASPEQIKGEPLTIATDVYSLAVVLYELLTGQRPYKLKFDSAAQLELAIISTDPAKPSAALTVEGALRRSSTPQKLARALAGDLDTIVLKALAKAAPERYLTIAEFAQDLRRHLSGQPVQARPASWRYRAKKFVVRNRLAVSAAGAVGVALVGAAGVSLWQAQLAKKQATLAQHAAKRAAAVQNFLLDIFRANTDAQPDPIRARETTARELLDIGAARIQRELHDEPQVQDQLLATLSDMYRALGLDAREAQMQRQRVEVRRRMFGPNDPRVAEALTSLAYSLRATAEQKQIPAVLAEAKAIVEAHADTPPAVRARLFIELARGDMYSAVTSMRRHAHEAARQLQAIDGAARDERATAWRLEALANSVLGYWSTAVDLFERALTELRTNDLHPFNLALTVAVELADVHARRGDPVTAERIYREWMAESMRRNGAKHVDTVHIEARLANLLHETGRRADARRMLAAVLEKLESDESTRNPGLVSIVHRNAASMTFNEGLFARAAARASANSEQARRLSPNTVVLASRLMIEAMVLTEMGRYAQAEALLSEAAVMHRAALGADAHPVVANRFALAQARLLAVTGRTDEATSKLTDLIAAPAPDGAVIPVDKLRAQVALASAHLAQRRVQQALDTAQSVLAELERATVRVYYPMLEAEALLTLGQAQAAAGDLRAARSSLERSLMLREANDDPNSARIAEAQIALAECWSAGGDRAHARSLIQRASAIHSEHPELADHYKQPLRDLQRRLTPGAQPG